MNKKNGTLIFSPSDLVLYSVSPFASWMNRYHIENPGLLTPDPEASEMTILAEMGLTHERSALAEFEAEGATVIKIDTKSPDCFEKTKEALAARPKIIFQAGLREGAFRGYADFLILNDEGQYEVWDTKLARSPKATYPIQLCCYSEMLAGISGDPLPEKFGVILGKKDDETKRNLRVEFRVEDFFHYYLNFKNDFLKFHENFLGEIIDRPEPNASGDNGRWNTVAEKYFSETDHLVRVAGITVGQIKKLSNAGIDTLTKLANADGIDVPKLAVDSLEKLVGQARLQQSTREKRVDQPDARPDFEVMPSKGVNDEPIGLAQLPKPDPGDVFFDIEGYPFEPGGLEYLFGVCIRDEGEKPFEFKDWWAHDRDEEKQLFEDFIDWTFDRWMNNPAMHIYHYAPYEVTAIRRLSTFHNTRQEELDQMLRNEVFVDLYQIVRRALRVGEHSYSLKLIEHLYRGKRETDVASAMDSVVQYAAWKDSGEPRDWRESKILKDIRDYNLDDCESTGELYDWLNETARANGIETAIEVREEPPELKPLSPEVIEKLEVARKLGEKNDPISRHLADLIDFHRREEKPIWWRMFDRRDASDAELRDDSGCIQGVQAIGEPTPIARSLLQKYKFDPAQECKLSSGDRSTVMFTHNISAKPNLHELDISKGILALKMGTAALNNNFEGSFPTIGSLIPNEYVSAGAIQSALTEVCSQQLSGQLPRPVTSLLDRISPIKESTAGNSNILDRAKALANAMDGDCLVIQGPPGTGKTYTASHVIVELLGKGKKIGITSNSHKAILNLFRGIYKAAEEAGVDVPGLKCGGENEDPIFQECPSLAYNKGGAAAYDAYTSGVIGGTAWLFARSEWIDELDYLFIDEAGQFSLANATAVSRSAKNVVLLGDHMQLEQPVQGSHPHDSGMSALQYALKDQETSKDDSPTFHAVIPEDYGLFLGKSYRMHPDICRFISESVYEGRLGSDDSCAHQRVLVDNARAKHVRKETGLVFCGIEHEGNIQQSDEEIVRIVEIFNELIGRTRITKEGEEQSLELQDFLFIAPYNAQVRTLAAALPNGARVGSVDKFQGQEAPVCILSMCSSFGEYGSRGLGFILDQNRVNVAISRAECLAIVVGDPRIAKASASSLNEMKLLNLYAKIVSSGA